MRVNRLVHLSISLAFIFLFTGCQLVATESRPQPLGRIAYASSETDTYEIYVVDPDGSDLRRLTNDEYDNLSPTWSPDGKKLAYASIRDTVSDIYILDVESGDLSRLTAAQPNPIQDSLGEFNSNPQWSPDGEWVLFDSNRNGNDDVYKIRINGTDETRLTDSPVREVLPRWSGDGMKIVFWALSAEEPATIYTMTFDGANLQRLFEPDLFTGPVAWAPEESRLIVKGGLSSTAPGRFFVYDLQDESYTQLTIAYSERYTDNSLGEHGATWSPDGEWVALVFQGQLCIIRKTGDDLYCLERGIEPDWGP